jgi:hypothetical protein
MKRVGIAIIILIVMLFGISLTLSGTERFPRYEIPSSLSAMVHITANGHSCSGFILLPNLVATAKHCVYHERHLEKDITVIFTDGQKHLASVKVLGDNDTDHDFVILNVPTRTRVAFGVSFDPIANEEVLAAVVYGGGDFKQKTIPLIYKYFDTEGMYNLNGNIIPGDSGAGVFNKQGDIVALIVRTSYPLPVGYAIPIKNVMDGLYSTNITPPGGAK